jgi:cytochrome c553
MKSKSIIIGAIALTALTISTIACAPSADPAATVAGQTDPAKIYSITCASCHGANRLGTPDAPNILKGVLTDYTATSLAAYIKGHQGQGLTGTQATDLANYLKTK